MRRKMGLTIRVIFLVVQQEVDTHEITRVQFQSLRSFIFIIDSIFDRSQTLFFLLLFVRGVRL